jgi:hypothetical protein
VSEKYAKKKREIKTNMTGCNRSDNICDGNVPQYNFGNSV